MAGLEDNTASNLSNVSDTRMVDQAEHAELINKLFQTEDDACGDLRMEGDDEGLQLGDANKEKGSRFTEQLPDDEKKLPMTKRKRKPKTRLMKCVKPKYIFDRFEFIPPAIPDSNATEQLSPSTNKSPSSNWVSSDQLLSAKVVNSRRFICVQYPAIIKNIDNAVAMLGGRTAIEQALIMKHRLELCFRPGDPYAKPTFGSISNASNFFVKVKRRKAASSSAGNTNESSDAVVSDGFEYRIEVLGLIDQVVNFHPRCDFQYLPVIRKSDGLYTEILSSLKPDMQTSRPEYLSRPAILFTPPNVFSRKEKPTEYNFEDDPDPDGDSWTNRKKREQGTICLDFNGEIPTAPSREAQINFENLGASNDTNLHVRALKAVTHLFQERPVWSKTGLQSRLVPEINRCIRVILPIVAFYFSKGPWLRCWCRFGYDPRKDATAKKYQSVDYRIRIRDFEGRFKSKRGNEHRLMVRHWEKSLLDFSLGDQGKSQEEKEQGENASSADKSDLSSSSNNPTSALGEKSSDSEGTRNKSHEQQAEKQSTSSTDKTLNGGLIQEIVEPKEGSLEELRPVQDRMLEKKSNQSEVLGVLPPKEFDLSYQFYPDRVPTYKQNLFQICDIHVEEVQRLAHQNDGKEVGCSKRDGWCVPDFTDLTRDILSEHVEALLVSDS